MSILKIAQIGNPILTKRANPIQIGDIKKASTQTIIDDMIETLNEYRGVGIAAPQVYKSLRIIVIRNKPSSYSFRKTPIPLTVLINPILLSASEKMELDWEGCLSIEEGDLLAVVARPQWIQIEYFDRKGKRIKTKLKGFSARLVMHEIDHLEGTSFFARIRPQDIKYITNSENFTLYHEAKWPKSKEA